MNLPKRYIDCEVLSKNNKFVGAGIFDTKSQSNALYLFCPDNCYQYTLDEVKTNFVLSVAPENKKRIIKTLLKEK